VPVAIASLGAVIAAYALASLTGCWLGKPPWWERDLDRWDESVVECRAEHHYERGPRISWTPELLADEAAYVRSELDAARARPGRERISGALVAVGFAAAVVGLASAWPRRSKARPTVEASPGKADSSSPGLS
jgi:hypothetical protein